MRLTDLRSFLLIRIIIILFSCTSFNAYAEEIESPVSPIIYGDGSGGFELYWFHPGRYIKNIGNNTIIPERGVIPSKDDRQYCIFTTIDLTPPYYIESANTYILNGNMSSSLPGDQYSPIRMAVMEKITDNYYDDLWYEYVGLAEDADIHGAFIERSTDLGIDDIFNVYLALEWLPGYPTSPMIGVNSQPPYFPQFICPMDDSSFNSVPTGACAMVGLEVLDWHVPYEDLGGIQNSSPMFYEVLFSDDSTKIYTDGEILATTGDDSLTASFNLSQSGYITIRVADMWDEAFSELLFVDINCLSDFTIKPQSLVLYDLNINNENNIVLENTGTNNLELSIRYDHSLFAPSENIVLLEVGATAKIGIELNEGIESQLPINSQIIIQAVGDYYPHIFHVVVSNKNPTSVESNDLSLPEEFNVSQPFPNPFNSSVRFNLSQTNLSPIEMDVYNLIGQKVYSKNIIPAKNQFVEWEADDDLGYNVCSGVYFIRFSTNNEEVIRKTILLK